MRMFKTIRNILFITAMLSAVVAGQTTEFTYQGQLQNSSMPASGNYDFEFALFDSVSGGSQVGSTQTRSGVGVSNGIFSVNLDFGNLFPGAQRFLEIRVRQAGGGAFTTLSPRQTVSSAPYAVKSINSDSATVAVNAITANSATSAQTAVNFTGPLAGDVNGTQSSTTVARLQGRSVATTVPLDGQVLKYNGVASEWRPDTDNTGAGGGGGTITGVTPGTGLTGGGATGNVTIGIANSGVGTAQLADGAVTDAKITSVSGAKVTGAVTNSTQLGGVAANQYVQTTDSRMTDARNSLPGSTNYIQNQNAGPQASSNFSISGNGTAGGTLSGNVLNAATQLNLGGTRILTATNQFFGSMYFGFGAGTNGLANTFFGYQAGQANSTSNNAGANSFFGRNAGLSNTDGGENSFFGSDAGDSNTTGSSNSFFGRSAGISTTDGNQNSFFGRSAGLLTTTGAGNTFVGANTGFGNTTGSNNTVLGSAANIGPNVSFGTAIGSGAVVTQSNTVVLGRPADAVSVPGTMTVTGALTANGAGLTNLNASNITTGTLVATRGGTGLAASGASGNFLRSNGAAWISSPLQAADIPTGSGNYIQNSAAQQAASNFSISGNGTAGGTLSGGVVNAATQFNLNGQRILSNPGTNNLFAGNLAGTLNTTGTDNAFFGYFAGGSNTTGNVNSFFGSVAGSNNTTGIGNSFFGGQAGLSNTTGQGNSFFGSLAGQLNTTASNNSFFGSFAGFSNATGSDNAFFGTAAGLSNTLGTRNSFFGRLAGNANTTGSGNSFFGERTGLTNTTGDSNAFFGSGAGRSNTTGSDNSFFGQFAGFANIGNNNAFFGAGTGLGNTSGGANAFFGRDAGETNTTGDSNTIIGDRADVGSANLTNATAIGANSFVTTSNSLVLGTISGVNGANANTNVGIGTTAPGAKLHVGANGGQVMIGDAGCSTGVASIGFGTTLECSNYALSGSVSNTFINRPTGGGILFRENNVDQMRIAAGGNVGIGTSSPDDKLDVEGDIRIGTSGINGCLRRNDGSALVGICSSDMRFKRDISAFPSVLGKVSQLRPVHYFWRSTEFPAKRFGDLQSYGLIAQEVEEVLPELVSTDAAGFKQIDYSKLPLLTIQAVKELKTENMALKQMLNKIEARLKSIENTVKPKRRARR